MSTQVQSLDSCCVPVMRKVANSDEQLPWEASTSPWSSTSSPTQLFPFFRLPVLRAWLTCLILNTYMSRISNTCDVAEISDWSSACRKLNPSAASWQPYGTDSPWHDPILWWIKFACADANELLLLWRWCTIGDTCDIGIMSIDWPSIVKYVLNSLWRSFTASFQ